MIAGLLKAMIAGLRFIGLSCGTT